MPTITLIADPATRKLAGLTEKDGRGWARFLGLVKRLLQSGSCITFTWREPRSGPFHRRFFAMLGAAFDAQERFDDPEQFRLWLTVGAGFCDFVPHPQRGVVAIPKSIAFDKLEQAEFQEVADAVWQFYRSAHAREILYPHLSADASFEMVWSVLDAFD